VAGGVTLTATAAFRPTRAVGVTVGVGFGVVGVGFGVVGVGLGVTVGFIV
jgi:hypothetical protein